MNKRIINKSLLAKELQKRVSIYGRRTSRLDTERRGNYTFSQPENIVELTPEVSVDNRVINNIDRNDYGVFELSELEQMAKYTFVRPDNDEVKF